MFINNSDRYKYRSFILFLLPGLVDCLTVYEGEKAVIVCSSSSPTPSWRGPPDPKNTIYTIEGSTTINPQLPNANRLSVDNAGNLVIKNTQRSDAGQYKCNIAGNVLDTTNLTVVVKPNIPQIMNKITDGNRTFVRATEDQSVTLICVSRGGYPEPEVAWKKGVSSLQPTFKEANIESDTTFTVTVKYTFISRRSDDRVQFTCQSSFGGTEPPLISSVLLYLSLKPSAPVMTGSRTANEGDARAFNCYSDGCRPTGNIFWRYNSSKIQRNVTFTNEPAETYRMESSYETLLQRADNGNKLECVVTHEALLLVPELVDYKILQIQFAPLSVTLSRNKTIIANGINKLELTCTTGSANPVAKITWRNGQKILLDGIVKTTFDGVYNGMVLRETLTLKPTRDMDGDIISCSTSNTVSSTAVQNETSLDLKYSPVTNIIGVSVRNLTEGDSNVVLQCSASGKPSPQFIWYHEEKQIATGENQHANQSNFTIQSVHRSHYGSYECLAYNGINPNGSDKVQLNIFFAPLSVKLSGNHQIIADGSNTLVLTCTSDTANPIGKLTWKQGQTIIQQHTEVTTSVGVYGGKVITEKLTLKPTRNMDGDIISCTSTNMYSRTEATDKTSLDLKYPSITSVPSVVNATEGDSRIILPCSASSKPPSHFKWFKKGNNTPLYQGNGTVISNALNYSIGVINRSHAGQYRCEADNGIGTPDNTEGILILDVFYPPDVTVIVINASVNETVFICNATGLPSTYNYSSWTQTWPGSNVTLRSHNGSRTWKIKHSDYQDTGVYRCGASNGIKETFTEGSVVFVVKSYPIITFPTLKIDHKYKVPAILSKRFTIAIDVYSNGDNADTLGIVMLNSDNNPVNGTLFTTNETEINLPVHGHLVTERGILIHVAHTITDQDDFGVFVLNIQNEVGTVPMHLEIVPEGPPCPPVLPLVEDYKQTTIQISWIRCFHGGSSQTFVVQYSNDKFTWINGTFVDGGLSRSTVRLNATIEYLQPETTYSIRIFSYNVYGRSGFTLYPDVATNAKESTVPSTPLGLIAGGATGGLVVAALIIVVLVFVVRRYHTEDRGGSKKLIQENETNASTHREGDSQDISINPMYEPADIVTPTKNEIPIYSLVDKTRPKVAQPDDKDGLYTPVGQSSKPVKHTKPSAGKQNRKIKKQKLGKIAKQEKRDRGEIYENSGACKGSGKDDENVYENPVCTTENETPIRTRNQDGLIYIDVDLPHLKKSNNGVSVIHGLDERTEYADIAFGKVGEKLPDSDDEEKKNTNQKDGEDNKES